MAPAEPAPAASTMSDRIIAIGDIHGYRTALRALLDAIAPQPGDTIVTLGDYVDRGPDSRGVIDELIALSAQCRLVPLLGNHDEMLLDVCTFKPELMDKWLAFGGDATIASYGGQLPEGMPPAHLCFLRDCGNFFESAGHFFVHGNYWPHLPLASQPPEMLRWESLKTRLPGPHCSGKKAVIGHSAQTQRQDRRPRLSRLHRHLLLWRRLVDRPGSGNRPTVASRQGWPSEFLAGRAEEKGGQAP